MRIGICVTLSLGLTAGCRTQLLAERAAVDPPILPLAEAILVVESPRPTSLAADQTHLYWTTDDGDVMQASKAGGVPLSLVSGEDRPSAIAADEDAVYWVNQAALRRLLRQTSVVETVWRGSSLSPVIAIDGRNVYVAATELGAVLQQPKSGEPPFAIVSGQQFRLGILGLAADSTGVYFSNHYDATVVGAPFGGTVRILASAQPAPYAVAAHDGTVFWTRNTRAGAVMRADSSGRVAVVVNQQASPWSIAIDGSHIYWLDVGDGSVWRAGFDGGNAVMLARTGGAPTGIVVDEERVFWADRRAGRLFATAK